MTQMEYWIAHEQTKLWVVILLGDRQWEKFFFAGDDQHCKQCQWDHNGKLSAEGLHLSAWGVIQMFWLFWKICHTKTPEFQLQRINIPSCSTVSWALGVHERIPSVSSISTHQTFCSRLQLYSTGRWRYQVKHSKQTTRPERQWTKKHKQNTLI